MQPPSDPDFADMCLVWEQLESGLWAWYGVDGMCYLPSGAENE